MLGGDGFFDGRLFPLACHTLEGLAGCACRSPSRYLAAGLAGSRELRGIDSDAGLGDAPSRPSDVDRHLWTGRRMHPETVDGDHSGAAAALADDVGVCVASLQRSPVSFSSIRESEAPEEALILADLIGRGEERIGEYAVVIVDSGCTAQDAHGDEESRSEREVLIEGDGQVIEDELTAGDADWCAELTRKQAHTLVSLYQRVLDCRWRLRRLVAVIYREEGHARVCHESVTRMPQRMVQRRWAIRSETSEPAISVASAPDYELTLYGSRSGGRGQVFRIHGMSDMGRSSQDPCAA